MGEGMLLGPLILFALAVPLTPGPNVVLVTASGANFGFRRTIPQMLGITFGFGSMALATGLGLAGVVHAEPRLHAVLKYAGAAYLIFLGLRLLLSKGAAVTATASGNRRPHGRIFRESILVEMLNPKTALFFLAFLPQFADPGAGPLAPQLLLLGGIVTLTAIPCDAFVALASGAAAGALARRPLYGRLQKWLSGSILVSLGAYVAASERP